MGVVEAIIALHYVFNSPIDQMVFDVSHQSFAHKIITGRRDGFINNKVSEYTNPNESDHDLFIMGHTSPSISMSCGLARGRDLKKENYNVIAMIGDGALSGGEAFEGLDNVSQIGTNMIIIVNDNQWAIAENHGGLYNNLKLLRESKGAAECNFFKALNLDYMYVEQGNDIPSLIKAFESVKDINHPIVVHIKTLKGKGYEPAIEHVEDFHYMPPFSLATGIPLGKWGETYQAITGNFLQKQIEDNPLVIAITSATPMVMNFNAVTRQKLGKQYIDVGIAEEHAVAFSSGLAKSGVRPVYPVFGTFLQRSFDQLSEDLCMQNNPAVVLVFSTGVYGIPDQSHQCFFDIIEISNIPNMVYLAPICKEEYLNMLAWAINQTDHPVSIRVPANGVNSINATFDTDYSNLNKFKIMQQGSKVAIIAVGSFFQHAQKIVKLLESTTGIKATLISPRYLTGIDTQMLDDLKCSHSLVVTLEDGIFEGGYGEKIAGYYGTSDIKVLNLGFRKEFVDRYTAKDLMKLNGLDEQSVVDNIKSRI